eukprot:scaffold10327_cov144-Skeletonema_menzelii.AAC.2
MSTRVTRQQANSSGGGGISSAAPNKLNLRNGKQITLAKWMTLQHVPEYGIVGKKLPLHNDGSDNGDATITPAATSSVEQVVVASHLRAKKEAALDSKFAPTTQEIYSHVRYLSEEGMKLIMRDFDECARESLRYSATVVGGGKGGNSSGNNFKTLAEEIHDYIEMFQPDDCDDGKGDDSVKNNNNNNATSTSLGGAEQLKKFLADMMRCRKYNPSLLPFITIKCYPNVLDRSEMAKILSADLSKRVSNGSTTTSFNNADAKRPPSTSISSPSSCVVTINSTSNLVQQGHLIAEILSQCISNDPNGEKYAMELTRQRKKLKSQVSRIDVDEAPGVASIFTSVWSWTNSLVDWCSTVECFDSIIVLLEDIENIPSPTLDTFLTTLISLRSWHGIPISVVLMDSIPGGLGDRLSRLRNPSNHDSGGGDGGVAACELELPLPQVQFDIFVNRLFFSDKCVPSFLWTNQSLWNHALEVFHEFDNSIMSLARHLKAELRRYFAVPGSFVTLLHCKEFVIPNESRLKWLFGEESGRMFLSIKQGSSGKKKSVRQTDKKDGHVVDLFRKIQVSYVCHQLLQKLYTIFELTPVRESRLSSLEKSDFRVRVPKLIHILHNARQKLGAQDSKDSAVMQAKLDEYIILLSHIIEGEEINNQMAKVILEDIIQWVEESFPLHIVLGEPFPPSAQPRRDVARALVLPPPKAVSKHCLSQATRTAFQVFQSRIMTLSDWYNKYFEVVTEKGDENSSEVAFFFAVYELAHMGFVRKVVTGRRSEETYEKIAIVFGSGR